MANTTSFTMFTHILKLPFSFIWPAINLDYRTNFISIHSVKITIMQYMYIIKDEISGNSCRVFSSSCNKDFRVQSDYFVQGSATLRSMTFDLHWPRVTIFSSLYDRFYWTPAIGEVRRQEKSGARLTLIVPVDGDQWWWTLIKKQLIYPRNACKLWWVGLGVLYTRNTPGSICQYKEDGLVSRPPSLFTSVGQTMHGTSCPKSQLKSTCLEAF